MGKEATCRVCHCGKEWTGKAHLDQDHLTIRGEHKVVAALRRQAQAQEGWLQVPTPDGDLRLELGEQAEKWAHAICNPKTLIDKLGLKPDMRILASGFSNFEWLGDLLCDRSAQPEANYDAILLQADTAKDLEQLSVLLVRLATKGMVWIVFPKGRADFKESQVFAAGKSAGLVDVKVCRFNTALTGLKFVRPKT